VRYFKATAISGRLLVNEPLDYWSAETLGRFAPMAAAEKKVHSVEELDEALRSDHQLLTLWLAGGWRRRRDDGCKADGIPLLYACPLRIVKNPSLTPCVSTT